MVSCSGTPRHLARRGRSPGIEPATFLLPDNRSCNLLSYCRPRLEHPAAYNNNNNNNNNDSITHDYLTSITSPCVLCGINKPVCVLCVCVCVCVCVPRQGQHASQAGRPGFHEHPPGVRRAPHHLHGLRRPEGGRGHRLQVRRRPRDPRH